MPELPETETIARQLDARVAGARLLGARVARPSVLREVDAEALDRRVAGAAVERVWRRAKLVVLDLSTGDRLVVQPRFTGALLLEGPGVDFPEGERRFVRVTFPLDGGPDCEPDGGPRGGARLLHYRDIRTLGTVALMGPERFAAYTAALGPEPLDAAFTGDRLRERLAGSRQAIKKVLMDQRRLAGVGNIYANEALLQARIAPTRPANSLSAAEGDRLRDALADRLARSVALGGTTFENFVTPTGGRGGFVAELRAYGRAGAPCPHCGAPLAGTHAVDGRSTVFCPGCQR
jgi:formamidopyrimidine-DNA glycosylase